MTWTIEATENRFPYVLAYSIPLTILSLAAVALISSLVS
jgi:hypothetical protein